MRREGRREGSAFQGVGTVALKELADHLSSARMRMLEWLVIITAVIPFYGAVEQLRNTTAEDPFLLLRLFTVTGSRLPVFSILGFVVPLVAIGLGFDAISGEHNRRTLSRILAQPIYRDALLAGKFLAGLGTLAISLLCLWLLIVGLGVLLLGVPPTGEEIVRSLIFIVCTVFYAGVWLALAMLYSIIFRAPATAALVALGTWFIVLLWPVAAEVIANIVAPPDPRLALLGYPTLATLEWTQALSRLSPNTLYVEIVQAILAPETRSLGPMFIDQLQGMLRGAALPLGESLAIAWPQAVALIAGTIVLFSAGYVVFQRQEVRA